MQNKGFKFTVKSSCFVKVDNFFLAVFFFNFTLQVAGYSVQSRRVPVPRTRLLIKTLVIDHEFRHHIVKVAVDPRGDSRVDPQTTLTML